MTVLLVWAVLVVVVLPPLLSRLRAETRFLDEVEREGLDALERIGR